MKPLSLSVFAAALAVGALQTVSQAAPPAPSPNPAPAASAAPRATATPAAPTEADDKRVGISGVWEVQIQQPAGVVYTHFKLDQKNTVLTGQYLDEKGKKYPLQGNVDGKDVHIIVTMPDGTALAFTGTVEANTDMAGVLDFGKDAVGFTAAYRPKYKWIDNLSPNPGVGTPGVP